MDAALTTPQELCQELGSRLRSQRLARLLAQDELARRAGVSTGTVRKLEASGQATVLTLLKVAGALGLAAEVDGLFTLRPQQSIADMERAESARRLRAPRRPKP